ncbi:uncharacterized protein LOC121656283 isoform X2 [Melanotaenia boesemani]|uniref:uncharacterized protein LOC121656283 isoform X2 n=1 Tax=Melanotaenia boesemani TaxID=1250792 RepID=UPI001C03B41E|nr:uncharacterized protein LOC121656283 isoform X2 [Melanotaenia boesemani]
MVLKSSSEQVSEGNTAHGSGASGKYNENTNTEVNPKTRLRHSFRQTTRDNQLLWLQRIKMETCLQKSNMSCAEFPRCNGITGTSYLNWVSKNVSKFRRQTRQLKSPAGAKLTIGHLEDTMYRHIPSSVDRWGKFYLPTTVKMQVIGYVEGTPYPCDQLVLMTCEDKKIYGYDEEEELHLVAESLNDLLDKGIDYPASRSFYKGEAFKHMTREDWEKVRQGPVGKRLDQEHHNLVSKSKSRLLENLRISSEKQRCHQQYGNSLPDNVLARFAQKGGS